jgi:large-conductance mechanosensitive channel
MITNLLNDILKIVKGRNGTIFLVILAIFAVMFFIKVIPALINFLIVAAVIFVIFKYIQKKSSE